ncbi:hypothetical protein ElyMa_002290100 [Elysia marginata]|uniref:Uncharacterized protein n=1 Tax=Elysia marginata TaxID=1093978 RepID=A0AAV4G3J8_9GAST|nr:hypothetical protein ElyMa_002290100 [Elysia marginata]
MGETVLKGNVFMNRCFRLRAEPGSLKENKADSSSRRIHVGRFLPPEEPESRTVSLISYALRPASTDVISANSAHTVLLVSSSPPTLHCAVREQFLQ